jgi:hypothetical protein
MLSRPMEAVIAIYSTHLLRVTVPRTIQQVSPPPMSSTAARSVRGVASRPLSHACCSSRKHTSGRLLPRGQINGPITSLPVQPSLQAVYLWASGALRKRVRLAQRVNVRAEGNHWADNGLASCVNARHEAMRRRTGRSDVQAQAICLSSPVLSGGETAGEIRLGPYPVQT